MKKPLLENKIIDSEKIDSFKRFKIRVGGVHSFIIALYVIGLYLFSTNYSESPFDEWYMPEVVEGLSLFVVILGSALLVIFVYGKTPSKGVLQLYEDSLVLKLKNETINLRIRELSALNFYIEQRQYFIGVTKNNKESIFEIDIVYKSEMKILNQIVQKWSDQGFQVKLVNKDQLSRDARLKKKDPNKRSFAEIKHNFSNCKIKVQPGIPFKVKTMIPYERISKKALFILSLEIIEEFKWAMVEYDSENIKGFTDDAFRQLGNKFTISFENHFMVMSIVNAGIWIFPRGGIKEIRSFLTALTELSNELDLEFLEQRYEKMF